MHPTTHNPITCKRQHPFWQQILVCGLIYLLLAMPKLHADVINMPGAVSNLPETGLTFSELYAENRQLEIADYITFDLIAHGVTRLWHDSIFSYESEIIQPLLDNLIQQLQTALAAQDATLATQANRDYAQVLAALLTGSNSQLSPTAQAEIELIMAAQGPAASPLFAYQIDYSQFKPRAAYDQNDARRRFFRAYRYAASTLFPLQPSAALGLSEAQQQLLTARLVQLIEITQNEAEFASALQVLQSAVQRFFPGRYASVSLAWLSLQPNATQPAQLLAKTRVNGMQPEVLYGLVNAAALPAGLSERDALTGVRLVPIVESMASRVFQGLVYNSTGAWQGEPATDDPAAQPKGLGTVSGFGAAKVRPLLDEFIALLGVRPLHKQLAETGEQSFVGYAEQWAGLQYAVSQLSGSEAARMRVFQQYLELVEQQAAGQWQAVETIKALWTELTHAEALYQAQSYTVVGKGMALAPSDSAVRGATIEAVPEAFLALLALTSDVASLSPPALQARWHQLNNLLLRAANLAQKVRDGTTLSLEEETFLKDLPTQLDGLTEQASKPIIIDIHSGADQHGPEVVYAATGFVREQVIEHQQTHYRGARYRYYGFAQSGTERLTDANWQAQLKQAYAADGQLTWRHKLPTTLLREWVLARALGATHKIAVVIYLAQDADSADSSETQAQLDDWLQQHDAKSERLDTALMLHLPINDIESLARLNSVKRIEQQAQMELLSVPMEF